MWTTLEQLKERWITDDGKKRLKSVVEAARRQDPKWSSILDGFPHAAEVKNGRDLRGANLEKADFWGADLTGANLEGSVLIGANLKRAFLENADLSFADLSKADLTSANLDFANLGRAILNQANLNAAHLCGTALNPADLIDANLFATNLQGAYLLGANLSRANLSRADLRRATLEGAILSGADLRESDLGGANLSEAVLDHADLREADLRGCLLLKSNLKGADISGAKIFGVSVWGILLDGAKQENLVITEEEQADITVDDIRVAQFIYLLLENKNIRDIIDTVAKKVVLILGRFKAERKAVLDAIRTELRSRNYTPVLFDFDKPKSRDITETVSTLAHMARFVIADITDAKSIPQELGEIVPKLPSVAVQPLIQKGEVEYAMFEHFKRYPWVLEMHVYEDQRELIANIGQMIIDPAERKVREQQANAKPAQLII